MEWQVSSPVLERKRNEDNRSDELLSIGQIFTGYFLTLHFVTRLPKDSPK